MTRPVLASLSPRLRGEGLAVALCVTAIAITWADLPCEWRRGGAAWRIVTCHFTHWTYEQLAWDALACLLLGIACARRDFRAFCATLLASVLIIPLAVSALAPDLASYRGLSGIDSALFMLALARSRRSPLTFGCVLGFLAKIVYEATTGGAVFATHLGTDVVSVPIAHIAGAAIGSIVGWMSRRVATSTTMDSIRALPPVTI